MMKRLTIFILILTLLFTFGCKEVQKIQEKPSDLPICYYIDADRQTVDSVTNGSEHIGINAECTQEGIKKLMDEYIRTKSFGIKDEFPINDYSVEAYVRLWGYRRGAIALVWEDFEGNMNCACKDSTATSGPEGYIIKDCEFIKEYLPNEAVFEYCFEE